MSHSGNRQGASQPTDQRLNTGAKKRGLFLRAGVITLILALAALLSAQPVSAQPPPPEPVTPAAPTTPATPTTPDTPTTPTTGGAATQSTSPCGTATDSTTSTDKTGQSRTALGATAGVIAQFAITGMCWTLAHVDIGTSPQLDSSGGNSWFDAMYTMFRSIALWVLIPLLLMATIHAVFKGSLHVLLKTFLVYLPVSIICGTVAVGFVQLLLNMTDDFTKGFINSISANAVHAFSGVADGFGVGALSWGVPFFVTMIMGLMLAFCCVGVYIILVLREASVYIATAFIPLSLAFFIWPSTAHFFKKLAEFLLAMIFSKLVMVAGIALAVAAMTSQTVGDTNATTAADGTPVAGTGIATGSTGTGSEPWFTWLGQTMTTTVMFGIVMFAPNMTIKLLANVGLSSMGRHVAEHSNRPDVQRKLVFLDRQMTNATYARQNWQLGGMPGARGGAIKEKREWAASTTAQDHALAMNGINRGADGTYRITAEAIAKKGIADKGMADLIEKLSASEDPNDVNIAHHLFAMKADSLTVDDTGHSVLRKNSSHGGEGEVLILGDLVNRSSRKVNNGMKVAEAERAVQEQLEAGEKNIRLIVPYDGIAQDGSHGSAYANYSSGQEHNALAIEKALRNLQRQTDEHGNQPYLNTRVQLVVDSSTSLQDRMNADSVGVGRSAGINDYG